jgi:hypothetical protein
MLSFDARIKNTVMQKFITRYTLCLSKRMFQPVQGALYFPVLRSALIWSAGSGSRRTNLPTKTEKNLEIPVLDVLF